MATQDQQNLQKILEKIAGLKKKILFATAQDSVEMQEQAEYLKTQLSALDKILGIKTKITAVDEEGADAIVKASKATEAVKDQARLLGTEFQTVVQSIPIFGDVLSKAFNLSSLGENLANAISNPLGETADSVDDADGAMKKFNLTSLKNPMLALAAAALAIVAAMRFLVTGSRDLAGNLGIAADQANDIMFSTKFAATQMSLLGYDSADLEQTMKGVVDEFGSLDNLSVSSAKEISMLAQNLGTSGLQIIKLNKSMMDLTGMSFEAATNFSEMAGEMAKAANVSAGKVIEDMAQNANKFAEFSMDGANGLAQAAIEAAKIGSNLSMVLGAADKLLDFETSLTAQFEAQVLTGKNLNLEKARQLSLEGDMLGLTQEIQKQVGSVGEIQSMNVIERRLIADAIGISSDDLLRVARGEQAKEQETQQSLQKKTNKILIAGFSETIESYKDNQAIGGDALDNLITY